MGPTSTNRCNNFSSNKAGDVRFGLAAVKGVGEAAVESIVAERNKNGKFKDIYDFFERVNYTAVNRKCLENIAYAGGFDSISGFHRCKFFGTDLRDNPVRRPSSSNWYATGSGSKARKTMPSKAFSEAAKGSWTFSIP